jgi:D-3-phosphoglycerate dehydrogenase
MKIVNIGDILLRPEMMERAVEKFERYTQKEFFFFGPSTQAEMRAYIKHMEAAGSRCVPLPEEILEACRDADVVQVHQGPIPSEIFEAAKNLKVVLVNRGGIENIDMKAAEKAGVLVLANPAHNANSVAELTIGLMIAETRNIGRCHASMSMLHKWRETCPNSGRCHELKGRTVGLVGFGTIGRIVAEILRAFQVRILVYDPFVSPQEVTAAGACPADLEELLKQSDIVSLHARVSKTTRGMMGEAQFRMMKPTAVFINTARAPLVDTDALYRALSEQWITGAALDSYHIEPIPEDDRFLQLDNVTFCCHKGGDTVESFENSPEMVLAEAEKYFRGENPRFLMNPQVLLTDPAR